MGFAELAGTKTSEQEKTTAVTVSDEYRPSVEELVEEEQHSRRDFLVRIGGAVVLAGAVGYTGSAPGMSNGKRLPGSLSPRARNARRKSAYKMRTSLARSGYKALRVPISTNGDEALYLNHVAHFSKSLPHNDEGLVDSGAFQSLLQACELGTPEAFEDVPAGGTLQLKNPLAAYSYTLEGVDPHNMYMPPPPALSSPELAAEAAEVYWHALLRDVPFQDYESDPLVQRACDELTSLSAFRGPRVDGKVTPATLFRGIGRGESTGPYLSQFLLKPMLMGHTLMEQKYSCAPAGSDYVRNWNEWLAQQRGFVPPLNVPLLKTKRHLLSGRDLAHHVHYDFPYQSPMAAALSMLAMYVPGNATDPYAKLPRQCGFATFGIPHIMDAMARVSTLALRAAWRHKWTVHRRTRPEEYAARIHRHLTAGLEFPAHPDLLSSEALAETFASTGGYILSQAYPEGCPCHPSFPSGHATFAGACVTVLKAFFDENFVLPDPVVPSADGQSLLTYNGPPLTVGGELNKLASNVAIGRNYAGVHWRSDAIEGIRLGERVAFELLSELRYCYAEPVTFQFSTIDGSNAVIG